MDRKHFLLARIDPATQHGLEIGALCRPVVPPAVGPIKYVDHLSTEALREKYATDPNVDVSQIVPVSYVWGASSLPEAVGDARFDYVIASHVIEHVPDPIGWFKGNCRSAQTRRHTVAGHPRQALDIRLPAGSYVRIGVDRVLF